MADHDAPGIQETFISHLIELRTRLVRASAVVLVVFIVLFAVWPGAAAVYDFLAQPMMNALPEGSKMIATGVITPFMVPMKVTMMLALMISLPWVLYQAWAFVAPGLYEHEKRFVMPLIVSSVFFLVVGISFAYVFVLPAAYKFFFSFTQQTGAETLQDLQKYWDFTLAIFFGFGLTFEVPVVQMLLVKLGIITTQQLREARRYVIVGAFVIAAVLTPPDVLSQFMLAVPLLLLYELGIFLSGFITARSRAPQEEEVVKTTDANRPTDVTKPNDAG